MIGIEVRFLAGRFHANAWHHAHNEGIPEWPPSPWRVLRALVSAAYASNLTGAELAPILDKLRALPRYRLPLASDAHTRHFMPDTDDPNHERAKTFDSFVAVDGGARAPQPVTIAWDATLNESERALLARLVQRVTYLGRAESWADLTVVDIAADGDWHCWPDERAPARHATTLLALHPDREALGRWAATIPKPAKGPDVPRTGWDVLSFEAARYRAEGWSDIPGTLRARYVFAQPPFRRAVASRSVLRSAKLPTVARFAIRSAVLPRAEDAMSVAERLRVSMMARSRDEDDHPAPVFSGHDTAPSNHQHAMYLVERSASRPSHLDHLIVSAKRGFEPADVKALQGLRKIWGHGGHTLHLVLVGLGDSADFGGLVAPRSPVLASSREWTSVTPFVPTRHPKVVRGTLVEDIPAQIRRACTQLLGVSPREIEPFGQQPHWVGFRRRRQEGGGRRGPDLAFGARLIFDEPVQGPIALGYGCHFGLGLFEAVK